MKTIRKKESCRECLTGVMSLIERNEWKKKKRHRKRERAKGSRCSFGGKYFS